MNRSINEERKRKQERKREKGKGERKEKEGGGEKNILFFHRGSSASNLTKRSRFLRNVFLFEESLFYYLLSAFFLSEKFGKETAS